LDGDVYAAIIEAKGIFVVNLIENIIQMGILAPPDDISLKSDNNG
jgi:hypothetical protein